MIYRIVIEQIELITVLKYTYFVDFKNIFHTVKMSECVSTEQLNSATLEFEFNGFISTTFFKINETNLIHGLANFLPQIPSLQTTQHKSIQIFGLYCCVKIC